MRKNYRIPQIFHIMFLAARKAAKQYHLQALKQWNIPFLLSAGTEVQLPTGIYSSLPEDEDLEEL